MATLLAISLSTLFIFASIAIWRTASKGTQEKFEKGFVQLEAIFERILQENLERSLFLSQDEEEVVRPLRQKNYEQLRANLTAELKKRVAIHLILVTDTQGQIVILVSEEPPSQPLQALQDVGSISSINRALQGEKIREILVSPSDFVLVALVPIQIENQILGACLVGSRVTKQVMESYSRISGLGVGVYYHGAKVL
ncbi:MAG: hypothetical protein L0Y56_06320, partial [Nitrospira sp.]|nr:hypothetical protein [Nitrospira sp.]